MDTRQEHNRIEAEIDRRELSSDPFASAVRATRMPMLITDPHQADNPIVFLNDAFCRLTGYTREEIINRNCRFLQGPKTNKIDIARVRDSILERVPIEVELLNYKKNGETFWNRLLISPVFDDNGKLIYFFASQFDVTAERERITRLQEERDRLVKLQKERDALALAVERWTDELTRSEDRLRFMLKAGRFGTWTYDLADRRLTASALCKEDHGRNPRDPFTYDDLLAAIVPEDRERVQAAVQASILDKEDYDIEYRVKLRSGETRWLNVRGQTSYRADGEPISMAGVTINITDRKLGEEHRNFLTDELNHRVKNSMATMQSIAHQTLRNASSLEEAQKTLDDRLKSLSTAHDVLTRENWEGATLGEIAHGALQVFQDGAGARFKIDGPEVLLAPRLALAFVMALHELATNAVKYGALSNETGRVFLHWDLVDGSNPERLWLRWEEAGGPPVTAPSRRGFGTRMIERALASELGGTAEIDYRPRGVVFTVEAPMPSS